MSTLARSPIAAVTRVTIARTRSAGSSGSVERSSATPASTSASTRAGRPASASPSPITSNSTSSAEIPGNRRCSSWTALHFASPTLAPSALARLRISSSALRSSMARILPEAQPSVQGSKPLASPSRPLLLLPRRGRRRLARPAVLAVAASAGRGLAGPRPHLPGRSTVARAPGRLRGFSGGRSGSTRRQRLRHREEPLDRELLADRPDVRRDPVDDQACGEADDHEDEDERQQQHDPALVRVLRVDHRHEARPQLRGHVDDDQRHQDRRVVRHRLRQVRDEQEAGPVDLVLEVRRLLELVQRDEERQLQQQREAGRQRVDLVLLVEGHDLLLLALLVVLVALLDPLHLRRQSLQRLHRAHLLEGERQNRQPDHHCQADDRHAPAESEVVVEELEDRLVEVDQRLEELPDCERDEAHRAALTRNSRWFSTGSRPPPERGLQRRRRQAARTNPRRTPYSRTASIAYSEQLGW